MTTIDDTTLMRVVALTALPNFIDIYGTITGTRNAVYNPTFVGERGFMLHVDAAPLDIGVPTTGDQLAECFFHTPEEIDIAMAAATPIVTGAVAHQKPVPNGPYNVELNGVVRKYWIDLQHERVQFDAFGGDEVPDVGVTFQALDRTLADYPDAVTVIRAQIYSLLNP